MRKEWRELPDVLRCTNGADVGSVKEWEEKRRPELLELFQSHVYGRIPNQEKINVTICVMDVRDGETIMNGKAVRKTVEVEVERRGRHFIFSFVSFIPKGRTRVPSFITICNRGIRDSDPSRDFLGGFWPAETIVSRGYAAIIFRTQEVAPDYDEGFTTGFHRLFPELAGNRPKDAYGAISAWSWAVSRVIDYVEKDPMLDEKKVAVAGHSRGGKTALWTAAQDQRVTLAVASCAGNTGDALSRGNMGETVSDITNKFSYWFCPEYKTYGGREEELPVDQHMLLGLIAPRLLYTSAKTRDDWADPQGQFESCVQAGRVYELYGLKGIGSTDRPIADQPIGGGKIGHHLKTGIHELDEYDWNCYLDFADRNL